MPYGKTMQGTWYSLPNSKRKNNLIFRFLVSTFAFRLIVDFSTVNK
jgi:hypothetical protein